MNGIIGKLVICWGIISYNERVEYVYEIFIRGFYCNWKRRGLKFFY